MDDEGPADTCQSRIRTTSPAPAPARQLGGPAPAACQAGPMTTELLLDAVRPFIAAGKLPGAVVGYLRGGEMSVDAAGSTGLGGGRPLTADALMRISSNTKPMVAVLALSLVDDGVLGWADPSVPLSPDAWIERFATLPLLEQPGTLPLSSVGSSKCCPTKRNRIVTRLILRRRREVRRAAACPWRCVANRGRRPRHAAPCVSPVRSSRARARRRR